MDYKYIEQLLERYWQCDTTLVEESILRTFFQQKEVPAHLLPYKALFVYQQTAKKQQLSDDFDARILAQIDKPVVKARRVTLSNRLKPLFKAVAVVAIALLLGTAAQQSFNSGHELDYNYDAYTDTYTDPQTAYGEISEALMIISESINKYQEQCERDRVSVIAAEAAENTESDTLTPDSITVE